MQSILTKPEVIMYSRIVGICLCLLMFTSLALAQNQRADYKKLDYIHVDSDSIDQFLEEVDNTMMPAYRQMVDEGEIRAWELYMVNFPGAERSGYNFVCIVTAPEIQVLQDGFTKVGSLYFMPSSAAESPELAALTKPVASEIWRVEILLSENDTAETQPAKYMMMDYMSVEEGSGPSYLTLESEVAKPLHVERAKNGTMADWEVYSLVVPGGTEYGYSFATGNFFENIADLEFGFTRELIRSTLPGTDITELLDTIYETRDLVKSELWVLVDHAR